MKNNFKYIVEFIYFVTLELNKIVEHINTF